MNNTDGAKTYNKGDLVKVLVKPYGIWSEGKYDHRDELGHVVWVAWNGVPRYYADNEIRLIDGGGRQALTFDEARKLCGDEIVTLDGASARVVGAMHEFAHVYALPRGRTLQFPWAMVREAALGDKRLRASDAIG